ncbi:MAG: S-adenosylmethionine decarboxylase [Pseudomonadota bacterium]|jgi:S-adenosylmethionine decarboxylase
MGQPNKKLVLQGFNNLTKTLSFNIYDICYARTEEERRRYIAYIDEAYNAERLTQILVDVANIIDAKILNIARQDYEPEGASVTMLVAESELGIPDHDDREAPGPSPENLRADRFHTATHSDAIVGHLDKSHLTVHTYPESHPDNGISTFRADIDVSTCGQISPLKALNYLIHSFESDIVIMDYRVRGFTRDVRGHKHYIDHKINSIQNYLDGPSRRRYQMIDVNVYQENVFHTKMLLKDFELDNYLFGIDAADMPARERNSVRRRLKREMLEIFYGRNFKTNEVPL